MDSSPSGKHNNDDKYRNATAEAYRRQEAIFHATEIAILSTSPEGIITSINGAAEMLLGYQAEELIEKVSTVIFYLKDELIEHSKQLSQELGVNIKPGFEGFIAKCKKQTSAFRREWMLVRKDQSQFPALVSVSAWHDDHSKIVGYIFTITDISNQKQIDERARATEEKFQILAENIPGAIYLCNNDAAYSVIYVNDHIENITGYGANDFLSGAVTFASLFHPEDNAMIRAKIDNAVKEKKKFHLCYRMKHRSGEWRWIDEVGIGVFVDGKLSMLEGFLSDITSQKESEEKLQQVASENLRMFNHSVSLNVVTDLHGYFKRVSQSWTKLLGWTDDELSAKPFIEFIHPEDETNTRKAYDFVRTGNNVRTFESRFKSKDGSYRWLLWSAACDPDHRVIYASATDITERKKYEEELVNSKKNMEAIAVKLQEQNRQLDEFAHIISHNLRSPVGNIQALINLLNDNSTIDDYKLIFDKLKNVAKNLGNTMNDLMDTLKVKTQTDVERAEIRFKDLLDKVVQSLEGELIMAEASVTYDFNKAPVIQYPKAYLESIFQNLLSNAIKYRSPQRKAAIHFETNFKDAAIELRVSDNGQGIDLQKFGDKVFGLHRTFHSHKEARGVGLFLIKTQIESMGGHIAVESEVNKGTTFIIRFG